MYRAVVLLPAASALSWDEIVDQVNGATAKWVAAVPPKFDTPEHVQAHLGALLPGDDQYQEPEVAKLQVVAFEIPDEFDSATNWPDCPIIAHVEDQSACGTCWAFASTNSFQDRACIATGKNVQYSTSDTAFCSTAGFGCDGGNSAWNWFTSVGVVTGGDHGEDGCKPYDFAPCAHHVPATDKYPACPGGEYPSPQCTKECQAGYPVSYAQDKVMAASAYSVRGVDRIMADLVQYGPLYVAFTVYNDFPTYKSGVYHHVSEEPLGGHAVELVGFGVEEGTDYWKIKNSWNEQWGDKGHFKIVRGTNECGIESSVSAGTIAAVATV